MISSRLHLCITFRVVNDFNSCWDDLRHKRAIDTTAADFVRATEEVGVNITNFGKQLHNYSIDHQLIPFPIIGKEMWVKHESYARSRAVSEAEHLKILRFISDPNQDRYRQYVAKHNAIDMISSCSRTTSQQRFC